MQAMPPKSMVSPPAAAATATGDGCLHAVHRPDRLERGHPRQDDLRAAAETGEGVGHDGADGDLVVAPHHFGVDVELGPEAGRPHQAAVTDQVVVEHREPRDHVLPQLLDEVAPGQGAVAPERADEADLVVLDARLAPTPRARTGTMGATRVGRDMSSKMMQTSFLPLAAALIGGRADRVQDRLPQQRRLQCRPIVPGHVAQLDLPAFGEGDRRGPLCRPRQVGEGCDCTLAAKIGARVGRARSAAPRAEVRHVLQAQLQELPVCWAGWSRDPSPWPRGTRGSRRPGRWSPRQADRRSSGGLPSSLPETT